MKGKLGIMRKKEQAIELKKKEREKKQS